MLARATRQYRDVHCAADPAAFAARFGWRPASPLEDRFAQFFRLLEENGGIRTDDWDPSRAIPLGEE
ncbi:hypothetical protein [Mesorhizobium sp. M0578]|uniref:hypothetical protein n=1 Tax=unclassified Mesorhizobium TaxID=325217 RepID=UPI00333A9059